MTELRIPCFRSRIPGTRHCSTQTVKTAGTQQKSNSAEFLSDGSLKTQIPPLAPAGGEGSGVRGLSPLSPVRHSGPIPVPWEGEAPAEPPECLTVLRLSRSFALPLWPSSPVPVPRRLPALPPLPHGRGSWLTPWCVGTHGPAARVETKGVFTPHPQPLSPSRGEGCRAVISG